MNLDSFGLATTPDENKPTSPKGWTKTSLTKDTDTEQLQSGVIYSTDYKAHSGESCLIIPYLNTAGASYYASDAKTLTKDGFYKISVWAKLSEGHTGKAYITLVATNYGENSKYVDYASQTIEVNSTDWKEYVFFIKAPSSDTKIDKYGDNAKDLSLKNPSGLWRICR
ncbi:MAG: carbohydrate binding domain-containing protein [Clostridiales bacterium]|nr:MAG: carbohydrate binding domain-containing protein [Clostridiales bacterium]